MPANRGAIELVRPNVGKQLEVVDEYEQRWVAHFAEGELGPEEVAPPDVRPDKFDKAAVRWHGRLELEAAVLTLAESELALAALGALRAGDKEAAGILLRRVRPTLVRSIG